LSKPTNYTDEVLVDWARIAIDAFRVKGLPEAGDPVVLELNGNCPRCGDPMLHNESLVSFKGVAATRPDALHATVKALRDAGAMTGSLLPAEFSVGCCCKVKHPDPLGRTGLVGCGAKWKMRFESVGEAEE
jgi:hypothetical protein